MAEFGIVVPGIQQLQRRLPELVEDADSRYPSLFRTQLGLLRHHMAYLFDVIATLDKQIEQFAIGKNALCQRISRSTVLALLPPALIATIGKSQQFREWPTTGCWLRLVPRQHSSGGKQVPARDKQANGYTYLRDLAYPWCRGGVQSAKHKQDAVSSWANQLMARRNNNIASVALANRMRGLCGALGQTVCAQ